MYANDIQDINDMQFMPLKKEVTQATSPPPCNVVKSDLLTVKMEY